MQRTGLIYVCESLSSFMLLYKCLIGTNAFAGTSCVLIFCETVWIQSLLTARSFWNLKKFQLFGDTAVSKLKDATAEVV